MRKLLTLLLLIVVAAKVAAVVARGPVPIDLETGGYWHLSTLAMSGDVLMLGEPVADKVPLYSWCLAIVRLLGGPRSLIALVTVQGILAFASIAIAALIAARITKLPRACLLALLVSLPAISALTFCAAADPLAVFVLLLMLNLLAVLDYAKFGTTGRAVWVGITLALAVLTEPVALFLWIPHVFFVILIHFRKRRRLGKHARGRTRLHHRVIHGVVAALAAGVLVAPWVVRQYDLFDRPLLAASLGRSLWVVTFQDDRWCAGLDLPTSDNGQGLERHLGPVGRSAGWRNSQMVSEALVASGFSDADADRLMREVAVEAIRPNQAAFFTKASLRVIKFWRCVSDNLPPQGPDQGEFRPRQTWQRVVPPLEWAFEHRWSQSVALNTVLAVVLGGAVLLLIINHPTRPYAIWLMLIIGYFAIVSGILEIPVYRSRIVVEPLASTVIGAAIAVVLSRRRRPVRIEPKA